MNRDYGRAWRQNITVILERLDKALHWVRLEHGRAATYKRLLREYYEGERSNEHFFAYHQAMEILSIFDSWESAAEDFSGIQDKISFVFKKGALLSEDENPSANSNRPRNDGFVYILAGKLLHGGGIQIISVDGIGNKSNASQVGHDDLSDIVLVFQETLIRIECKRPMDSTTLENNAEIAFRQIKNPRLPEAFGIIAVDASKIIERPGQYLEASSLDGGSSYLTDELAKILTPLAVRYNHGSVLGLIGLASIPLVATAKSKILKSDGTPFEIENLRTSAVSWVAIKNPKSLKGDLLHELQRSFLRTTHGVPQNSLPMI